MTNVQVGDMAIVVSSNPPGPIIGRIVKVLRPAANGEIFVSTDGQKATGILDGISWVVAGSSPLPWGGMWFEQRAVLDSILRPISGLPVDDEVTEDLKEPA